MRIFMLWNARVYKCGKDIYWKYLYMRFGLSTDNRLQCDVMLYVKQLHAIWQAHLCWVLMAKLCGKIVFHVQRTQWIELSLYFGPQTNLLLGFMINFDELSVFTNNFTMAYKKSKNRIILMAAFVVGGQPNFTRKNHLIHVKVPEWFRINQISFAQLNKSM